jgi:hypothetical protein
MTKKSDEVIRKYRQLPPLKRPDAVNEKASKQVESRPRPHDNYASSSMTRSTKLSERRRDFISDSSNDEGDRDENDSEKDDDDNTDESKYSDDDDKRYDDGEAIRHDYDNKYDNFNGKSCNEDVQKSYKNKICHSDDTDLALSRDRHLDDLRRNNSSLSSASADVSHVLKTSSYKFVPPGGVVSRDRRPTKTKPSGKSSHHGTPKFKPNQGIKGETSLTIYNSYDTVIRNSRPKSRKESSSSQRSKSHDSGDEDDAVYRRERSRISRRSRSASPDWSSSQSTVNSEESQSRSTSSQDCFDIRVSDWPIHYTQTCLLADCDKCLNADHATGSRHRRYSDNNRRAGDVSRDAEFSESKAAKSKWKTSDLNGGKDRTSTVAIKLNLIGHMIDVGQSHRMMSCKT